jgi:hypothetical protein
MDEQLPPLPSLDDPPPPLEEWDDNNDNNSDSSIDSVPEFPFQAINIVGNFRRGPSPILAANVQVPAPISLPLALPPEVPAPIPLPGAIPPEPPVNDQQSDWQSEVPAPIPSFDEYNARDTLTNNTKGHVFIYSKEYKKDQHKFMESFQELFKCKVTFPYLKRDANGKVVVDYHPENKSCFGIYIDDGYARGIFGNYASPLQKLQHIINDKGRGTCFTIRQIYNAIQSVLPGVTLHIINFSDDYLCNQADFKNTEGEDLNTIKDCFEKVMNGDKVFSDDQISKVEHLRVIYYKSFFKDAIQQGYKGFICLVYGGNPAKKLLPLINEAYAEAIKDCNITKEEFELIVTVSPHFGSVIHDDTTGDTLKKMDKSITVLIRHPDPTKQCNYFQGEIIARLRLYYSTPKKDRISAIIKFLSKYKDLDTNVTSTNMTLDSVIADMSGIVHTYYENHKDSIVEYANENKLDGDAMDYDETNIHIRHLAQYFAWTGQRARAGKRAAILEFLSKYKDPNTNETTTTITLNAVIANMSEIVRSYFEEEKASIVIYANENKSVGDMTDYNENNIHIRHLAQYFACTGRRARAEKRAAILAFLSEFKDLHTSTTITLNEIIHYMSETVRSYYEEEKASIVAYANEYSQGGI